MTIKSNIEEVIQSVLLLHDDQQADEFAKQEIEITVLGFIKRKTSIFTIEPDTRGWWWFHDRKVELGLLLLCAALIYVLWT